MNKRLAHILGIFVLVIFTFIFYDGWFHPEVPPALQKGSADNRPTENLTNSEPVKQEETQIAQTSADGRTTITLTSLNGDDGSRNGSFSNSQEISHKNSTQNYDIQLESLAVQENTETLQQQQEPESATVPSQETAAKIWIQAGSFGKRENAEVLAKTLREKKFVVSIETAEVNGAVYNRVYVGPVTEKNVDNTLNQLSSLGVQARRVTR